MQIFGWRTLAWLIAVTIAVPAAADPLRFSGRAGGPRIQSMVANQRTWRCNYRKSGKPKRSFRLPSLAFGFSLGEVALWKLDRHQGTVVSAVRISDPDIVGHLPEDVVPICKVPASSNAADASRKYRRGVDGPSAKGSLGGGDWRRARRAGATRRPACCTSAMSRACRTPSIAKAKCAGSSRPQTDPGAAERDRGIRLPGVRLDSLQARTQVRRREMARASTMAASRAFPPMRKDARRHGSSVATMESNLRRGRDKNLYALDARRGAKLKASRPATYAATGVHGDSVIRRVRRQGTGGVGKRRFAALDLRRQARSRRRCGCGRRSRW